MKKHNEQFEKNIARLIKSTREQQIPSENFTHNLIEEALKELPNDPSRRQRSTFMKRTYKRLLVTAAALIIVFGITFSILTPSLCKVKTEPSSAPTMQSPRFLGSHDGSNGKFDNVIEGYDGSIACEPVLSSPTDDFSSPVEDSRTYSFKCECKVNPITNCIVTGSAVETPAPSRMANGGTTPPNGEDVDAMFFKTYGVNPFVDTEDDHLSTFAIDVDTGSYTVCRRFLNEGSLPPKEAVRVEEFVNYFDYDYPAPRQDTFAVFYEAMPWQFDAERKNTHLMRIGLKAMEIPDEYRKPAILTFVIDVSGSMDMENRLGLVKQSLRLLVNKLRPDDKIGIAVYGRRGRQVLPHTGLANKRKILKAIDSLHSEGSTNAEEGIRIGYDMADQAFVPGYINRVILCSDGVANVGNTGHEEIFQMIKNKADKGVTLSTLGFGMGNYNDVLMERLGDKGNGYYAYIDTLDEAKRLFSNLTGALQVVARDVKIQVDFNPDTVRSYRLIGYENRDVADIDFRNDTVDGGEIGAGHSTTALYELKLWPDTAGDIATTYIRYKDPDTFAVTEISADCDTSQIENEFDDISQSFALATIVTEFAEIMRDSYWAKGVELNSTLQKAKQLKNELKDNKDLNELMSLIEQASRLLQTNQSRKTALEPADIQYHD